MGAARTSTVRVYGSESPPCESCAIRWRVYAFDWGRVGRHSIKPVTNGYPFMSYVTRVLIAIPAGELPVWIRANSIQEIESSVEWADREQVNMVLVGGADAPRAKELLKRKNIPVIVTPILRLPIRRHADYDEQFTVPLKLYEAGIPFCIAGGSGYGNERNLPYHAAMAAAFGLPKDVALKSLTQFAAELLGVGDRWAALFLYAVEKLVSAQKQLTACKCG